MTRRSTAAEQVAIAGPAGSLEALVEAPSGKPRAIAVLCHPHPLHGGTMTNKVVHTLARTFQERGAVAVRFNFRGVGASAGVHAHGDGERRDAEAVARFALAAYPNIPLYLAGFSFGAAVAATAAGPLAPAALVSVALPVARLPAPFSPPGCPWLIVHGSDDEIVPLAEVERWRERHASTARFVVIDGATHFFHGRLLDLSRQVADFVAAEGDVAATGSGATQG